MSRYDLLVFEVGLELVGSGAPGRCELRRMANNILLYQRHCLPADIGLPDRIDRRQALYQGYDFRLPPALLEGLASTVAAEPSDRPLWIHLAKPYGYLSMVPWERLLQPVLGRPLLRLPEYLSPPPRETSSSLDVILCGSAPVSEESFGLVQHLLRIADRILEAVPRRTTLHVFTDRDIHDQLRQEWENRGLLGNQVRLHSPESAEPYAIPDPSSRITDPGGRLQSPWLLWMRDSLGGRSVDVVHFLCHGYLSRDRGALQLAESPLVNQDRSMSRLVGSNELNVFLTQIGAWSVTFSSPEYNYSEMGLRELADSLSQTRPGPVLRHDVPLDVNADALAAAYRFLYSRNREAPPSSPALALYCQPSQVAEKPMVSVRGIPSAEAFGTSKALESVFETEENVPSWVAATERFIEQKTLQLRETAPVEAPRTRGGPRTERKESDPVKETLRQIQEIVARAAASRMGGGK